MAEDHMRLRWTVERRLTFIELRLYWEGRINRSDLVESFGISVPQASQDLARYDQLAPGNLVYDKTAKTYVAGPNFRTVLAPPSADAYFAQLRSIATGGISLTDSWIGRPPDFVGAPRLQRRYDPKVLQYLIRCIRNRQELKVKYLSFSEGKSLRSTIAPHAFGFDGQRWHVRAFCYRRMSFRDFVISRLTDLEDEVPSRIEASWDLEWSEPVEMKLIANSLLPKIIRAAIESDYGMQGGVLDLKISVCSSYYLESQLNLELDKDDLPPRRLQLLLINREEVVAKRTDVKKLASQLIHNAGLQTAA